VLDIAVTGGAGFIGSNLVAKLCALGHRVMVVDNFSTGLSRNLENLDCKVANISILDRDKLKEAFCGADYIFHLAAVGSVPRSIVFPEEAFRVNAYGTLIVLEVAREIGTPVLFSSSSSVYGLNQELPKSERMWTLPISPYAASKLAAESLVVSYIHSYGMKNLVLRFFNVFGPKQRSDHDYAAVIPKWIKRCIEGSSVEVFGDGSSSRDFTYVDFVVNVMIDAMNRQVSHETPVNVATGHPVTLNELVEELRKSFHNLQKTNSPNRLGDVLHSSNDPLLLRKLFPRVEDISLSDGVMRTIEWTREQMLNG
jgi:UDP-glucose 4-epimerase